jgi:hypothetical protein
MPVTQLSPLEQAPLGLSGVQLATPLETQAPLLQTVPLGQLTLAHADSKNIFPLQAL